MYCNKKIKKQFEHAKSSNDDICKFNSLWISFNCFYNDLLWNGADRQKIDNLKINEDMKKIFSILEADTMTRFYDFINKRSNQWVRNLRNDNIVKYLCKDCFAEFLEIIYTIRNNQFHWWKNWEEESDISLLIETNLILESFLEKLYNY